jgi:hypothetical protein
MLRSSESQESKTKITQHSKKKSKEKEKVEIRSCENDPSNRPNSSNTTTNISIPFDVVIH